MTWTNGRSHLTNYLLINVSIIHHTIGAWLHKTVSKVTRLLCAEWQPFIGLNKIKAVMAMHMLYLTLMSKHWVDVCLRAQVAGLVFNTFFPLFPPSLPHTQMAKLHFVSSWSLSSVKRTLSFGQRVRTSVHSRRTKSWRPRPTAFTRSSLKVKLPKR